MKIFLAFPFRRIPDYRVRLASALPDPPFEFIVADRTVEDQQLLYKIRELMDGCDLSLFDITEANPNVLLELGYAMSANYPYVIAVDQSWVPHINSDLNGWDSIRYDTVEQLSAELRVKIDNKAVPRRGQLIVHRRGHHELGSIDDPNFAAKVKALVLPEGWMCRTFADSPLAFDPTLNLRLETARTYLDVARTPYQIPALLEEYYDYSLHSVKPDTNDDKVRLATELNRELLDSGRSAAIQRTTYGWGVASNELATKILTRTFPEKAKREIVCRIFDNYVADHGRLIALSDSELSNHIGGTTVLITSDHRIVLQMQGKTKVDWDKMMVGASGSTDWDDVAAAPPARGSTRRTLQNLARYAIEREAREEIGVETGPGLSRTTITGYGRVLKRGAKPDFFFITFLKQTFDDIPTTIHPDETRFVTSKEPFPVKDGSMSALLDALERLTKEFEENRKGSASMLAALAFARDYLRNSGRRIADLRP